MKVKAFRKAVGNRFRKKPFQDYEDDGSDDDGDYEDELLSHSDGEEVEEEEEGRDDGESNFSTLSSSDIDSRPETPRLRQKRLAIKERRKNKQEDEAQKTKTAEEAAESLRRELEVLGYNLESHSFITKSGSGLDGGDEERYSPRKKKSFTSYEKANSSSEMEAPSLVMGKRRSKRNAKKLKDTVLSRRFTAKVDPTESGSVSMRSEGKGELNVDTIETKESGVTRMRSPIEFQEEDEEMRDAPPPPQGEDPFDALDERLERKIQEAALSPNTDVSLVDQMESLDTATTDSPSTEAVIPKAKSKESLSSKKSTRSSKLETVEQKKSKESLVVDQETVEKKKSRDSVKSEMTMSSRTSNVELQRSKKVAASSKMSKSVHSIPITRATSKESNASLKQNTRSRTSSTHAKEIIEPTLGETSIKSTKQSDSLGSLQSRTWTTRETGPPTPVSSATSAEAKSKKDENEKSTVDLNFTQEDGGISVVSKKVGKGIQESSEAAVDRTKTTGDARRLSARAKLTRAKLLKMATEQKQERSEANARMPLTTQSLPPRPFLHHPQREKKSCSTDMHVDVSAQSPTTEEAAQAPKTEEVPAQAPKAAEEVSLASDPSKARESKLKLFSIRSLSLSPRKWTKDLQLVGKFRLVSPRPKKKLQSLTEQAVSRESIPEEKEPCEVSSGSPKDNGNPSKEMELTATEKRLDQIELGMTSDDKDSEQMEEHTKQDMMKRRVKFARRRISAALKKKKSAVSEKDAVSEKEEVDASSMYVYGGGNQKSAAESETATEIELLSEDGSEESKNASQETQEIESSLPLDPEATNINFENSEEVEVSLVFDDSKSSAFVEVSSVDKEDNISQQKEVSESIAEYSVGAKQRDNADQESVEVESAGASKAVSIVSNKFEATVAPVPSPRRAEEDQIVSSDKKALSPSSAEEDQTVSSDEKAKKKMKGWYSASKIKGMTRKHKNVLATAVSEAHEGPVPVTDSAGGVTASTDEGNDNAENSSPLKVKTKMQLWSSKSATKIKGMTHKVNKTIAARKADKRSQAGEIVPEIEIQPSAPSSTVDEPKKVLSPCMEDPNENDDKPGNLPSRKSMKSWYSASSSKIKGMARKVKSSSSQKADTVSSGTSDVLTTETPLAQALKKADTSLHKSHGNHEECSPSMISNTKGVPTNLVLNKDNEDASMLTSLQSSGRSRNRNIFSDAPTINSADIANADAWDEIAAASLIVEKAIKKIEPAMGSRRDTSPKSIAASSIGPDVEKALLSLKKHAERLGVKESDLLLAVNIDDEDTTTGGDEEENTMEETVTIEDNNSAMKTLTMKEEILEVFKMVLKEK